MSVHFVVPCFNEADRWNEAYWSDMLERTDANYCFVDDGSSDRTAAILEYFAERRGATFLKVDRNAGKAEAVRRGWLEVLKSQESSEVTAVGLLDADGAFRTEDVSALIGLATESLSEIPIDAWWSSRVALAGRDIRRNLRRHYLGRIIATYLSWGAAPIPYDTQSGLKLFQASTDFESIIQYEFATRWLFEVEILTRFNEVAGRPMSIWEMPLNSWMDIAGSKVTSRESVRIARDLARLKLLQRRGLRDSRGSS